jgi:hypothetical protein
VTVASLLGIHRTFAVKSVALAMCGNVTRSAQSAPHDVATGVRSIEATIKTCSSSEVRRGAYGRYERCPQEYLRSSTHVTLRSFDARGGSNERASVAIGASIVVRSRYETKTTHVDDDRLVIRRM